MLTLKERERIAYTNNDQRTLANIYADESRYGRTLECARAEVAAKEMEREQNKKPD